MKRTLLLPLVLSLLAPATSALAQDSEVHVRRGVELRRVGDDDAALEEFRAAYAIDRSGRVLGQMAFAEQALGLWADAATHLNAALATSHPWVSSHRAAIREALDLVMARLGRLDLRGGETGAEVIVDGQALGTLPLQGPLLLPPGDVALTIRADGFADYRRTITITAGQLARETINMRQAGSDDEGTTPSAGRSPRQPSETFDSIPLIAAGAVAVGVFLGTGIGTAVWAENRSQTYNATCAAVPSTPGCADVLSEFDTANVLRIASFSLAGAFLIGTVIVLIVDALD